MKHLLTLSVAEAAEAEIGFGSPASNDGHLIADQLHNNFEGDEIRPGSPASDDGYWICDTCDEVNRARRHRCNNCGEHQPSLSGSVQDAELALQPSAPTLEELERNSPTDSTGHMSYSEPQEAEKGSRGLFLSSRTLQHCNSGDILRRWLNKSRGMRAAVPEYQRAIERICIAPELMSSSRLWEHLKFLNTQTSMVPPYEEVILQIIHKAYSTRFLWTARFKSATVPGLGSGNLMQGAVKYYQALQWERPYLVRALELLHTTETPDGLQLILGLMLSGHGWCHARKTFVFNTIISRVHVPAALVADRVIDGAGESPRLHRARQAIMEIVTEFIEDTKEHALKSTFLEPTKMYFRGADDPIRENQVDVHGANTYLAILSATLGVQLNRVPYMDDWAIGCADFLANGAPEPLAWAETHFGRDWEGVRELREEEGSKPQRNPGLIDKIDLWADMVVMQNRCGFVFKGTSPKEVANSAVNPSPKLQERRRHLARYLEKFASWFSEDFILPRLVTRLIGETGRLEALQELMDDLVATQPQLAGEDGEEDVRYWLWNMAELPPVFQKERAVHLMRHVGLLGTPELRLPPLQAVME
jgi:hypothetical protein